MMTKRGSFGVLDQIITTRAQNTRARETASHGCDVECDIMSLLCTSIPEVALARARVGPCFTDKHLHLLTFLLISMSFLTDTAWPARIVNIFGALEASGLYFAVYNRLLFHCFDPSEVIVTPEKIDFDSIYLIVSDVANCPLLITNVENDISLNGRFKADAQMRQRYDSLLSNCTLPMLWGLSFVGPYLRVYHGDAATGRITTPWEEHLEEAWNISFLSPEGFATIQEIVGDIVNAAAAVL